MLETSSSFYFREMSKKSDSLIDGQLNLYFRINIWRLVLIYFFLFKKM